MKVQALINCTGIGYKDFKKEEIRNLPKKLADKLLKANYVKTIEKEK